MTQAPNDAAEPPLTTAGDARPAGGSARPALVLGGVAFLAYALLGTLRRGYGNVQDTYLMLNTWNVLLHEGRYTPSRGTGYLPPELAIGLTSEVGGYRLANGVVALMAALCLILAYLVVRRLADSRTALLTVLAIGLSPDWIVSASSSIDYLYSLGFFAIGVALLMRRRLIPAALVFGLSVGSRLTLAAAVFFVIVAAAVVHRDDRRYVRALLACLAGAAILSAAFFIPAFHAAGQSLAFADLPETGGDFSVARSGANFLLRQLQFWGLPALVLLVAVVLRYGRDYLRLTVSADSRLPPETRFLLLSSLLVFVFFELFFFRWPRQVGYLIPALPAAAILLALTRRHLTGSLARWGLPALVACVTVNCFAAVNLLKFPGGLETPSNYLLLQPRTIVKLRDLPMRSRANENGELGLFLSDGLFLADWEYRDSRQRQWMAWLREHWPQHGPQAASVNGG